MTAVVLCALVALAGCHDHKQVAQATAATLQSIEITPPSPKVAVGTSVQLTATGIWSNNQHSDLTGLATWNSSNPANASVGASTGSVHTFTVGTAAISVSYGGQSATANLTVTPGVLMSVAVTPAATTLAVGTSEQLIATGTFSDGTTQDVSADMTWSSSASAIATVSSSGLEHALAVGPETITATCSVPSLCGTLSGSSAVTVTAAVLQSIQVTPTSARAVPGLTQQFTATGLFDDGTRQDLTNSVTWASDNPAVVTISNAMGRQGLASSTKVGTANITAASGDLVSSAIPLTVTGASLASLDIVPATPSIPAGTTQQFTVTGTYSDHTTHDLTDTVVWSSNAPDVATISNAPPFGLATSSGAGNSTITAASGDVRASVSLTVTPAILESIQVSPSLPSVALGLTQPFIATGFYSDGTHRDITNNVTWASDTPSVATISNAIGSNGLVTTAGVGITRITATSGNIVSSQVSFTVAAATLSSIAIAPSAPSIPLGTTQPFTATGTYTDGTTHDLTSVVVWSSSDPQVATISNATPFGLATAKGVGQATITAAAQGIEASVPLVVGDATLQSIQVSADSASVPLGLTKQFTATGIYTDGTTHDLTSSVTWTSDTPSVATISNAAGSWGLASPLQLGSATITATSATTSIVSQGVTLDVTPALLTSIEITPSTPITLFSGTVQQLSATGSYSDGTTQDLTHSAALTWSSTTDNVTVLDGLVTAISVGTATLSANVREVVSNNVVVTVNALTSPANLSYTTMAIVYLQNQPITPNLPSSSGGPIKSYSVSPALPAGLDMDTGTGVISGTPTEIVAQAPYTVTASNDIGSISTTLQIKVAAASAAGPYVPTFTVGHAQVVPTPHVSGVDTNAFNDSVFPFLPSQDGSTMILFWGDGWAHRYAGPDLMHMQPAPGTLVTRTRAPGVPSGPNAYDYNGDWMNEAHRMADGSLVAFVHAENHIFSDGVYGEQNSTGLWISTDDGYSWTDYGQVVGSLKPANGGGYHGSNLNVGPIWDEKNSRWLGYDGQVPYVSKDPHGMPGTWFAKDSNEQFTIPVDPTVSHIGATAVDSLPAKTNGGNLSFNSYLNEFVMVYQCNGDNTNVHISFSKDGLNWGGNTILAWESSPGTASYPQLIGTTDQAGGQDMQLVYERTPPTGHNRKDIVTRPVHFN